MPQRFSDSVECEEVAKVLPRHAAFDMMYAEDEQQVMHLFSHVLHSLTNTQIVSQLQP